MIIECVGVIFVEAEATCAVSCRLMCCKKAKNLFMRLSSALNG